MRCVGVANGVYAENISTAAHNALQRDTEGFMFYGIEEGYGPNFEVLCFDEANTCVNKEYFHTYAEAREFEESEQTKLDYEWVSVTPMNARAHVEMYQAQKKS